MQVGSGEERVDAGPCGVPHGTPGGVDVGAVSSGQPGNDRSVLLADLARDSGHRLMIIGARGWKSGLDDVDTKSAQLPSDLDLLCAGETGARGLLPIAQCRVENAHDVGLALLAHGFPSLVKRPSSAVVALASASRVDLPSRP